MKSAALACAFLFTFFSVQAQQLARLESKPAGLLTSPTFDLQEKPLPGFRMRNTGRALTIGGLALFTGGLILMNSGPPRSTHPNVTGQEPSLNEPLGFMMAYGGVGMTIPGIILWRKGSKKYRRSLEREGLSVESRLTTVSLRYGF